MSLSQKQLQDDNDVKYELDHVASSDNKWEAFRHLVSAVEKLHEMVKELRDR